MRSSPVLGAPASGSTSSASARARACRASRASRPPHHPSPAHAWLSFRSLSSRAWSSRAFAAGLVGATAAPLLRPRPPRRPRLERALATRVRDYYSRDDVREGTTVAYAKKGRPHIAVVRGGARRRLVPVLDHTGATDTVELKAIESAFPRADDAPPLTLQQLRSAHAFADALVAADRDADRAFVRAAWRRARGRHADEPATTIQLARCVFPEEDDDADDASTSEDDASASVDAVSVPTDVPSDVARGYAAHRLLSDDGVYFRTASFGRFVARGAEDAASYRRLLAEQSAEDASREAMWERFRDAIRAPATRKPHPDAFHDGSLLQLRVESLEAFALGDGRHTVGQRAAAEDTLARARMRVSERSAFDALVAIGRWRGHEDLAMRRYDVPVAFDEETLASAAATAANPPPDEDARTRRDLTRLAAYAVDADDTVEIDDAVSAEAMGDGRIRVWIHVADATRWVARDSPVDVEAARRGTSGYAPTGTTPMIPFVLSAGEMSLAPGEDRCAVSVTAVLDRDGNVEEYWMGPSVVRVTRAMTEEETEEAVSAGESPGLRLLAEAARRRAERRRANGAVEIRMPEASIKVRGYDDAASDGDDSDADDSDADVNAFDVAPDGYPGRNHGERSAAQVRAMESASMDLEMRRVDHNPAQELVSEMMILCGELVGTLGAANDVPLPYRGQAPPRALDPEEMEDVPEGLCREHATRQSMRGASSGATPRRHASLALDAYVQFTSPIRRYTDLVAHRQVKAFLRGEPPPLNRDEMQATVDATEERARTLRAAVRDATEFWTARWFERRAREDKGPLAGTIVKWIHRDQGVCVVILDETGSEHKVKLDPRKPQRELGNVARFHIKEADAFGGRLVFAEAR